MPKYLLIAALVIVLTPIQAQKKGYIPGYIINIQGDTLNGWVKDRSSGPMLDLYSKIRLKSEGSIFKKKYRPQQVLGYGYGNQHFVSFPLRENVEFFKFRYYVDPYAERVFLKRIKENPRLVYYHMEYMDDDSNFIDFVPLFYKPGSDQMVRVTQGILGLKKKRLAEYFNECPQLVKAVINKDIRETEEVWALYMSTCK